MFMGHIQKFFALRKYLMCDLKSIAKLFTPCHKRVPAPENDHLVGLVVKDPAQERQAWVRFSLSPWIFFQVESYQWLKKWSSRGYQRLPCQAPGFLGAALEPVGPVSVYCGRVRYKVWSATSISVWQHTQVSSNQPTKANPENDGCQFSFQSTWSHYQVAMQQAQIDKRNHVVNM